MSYNCKNNTLGPRNPPLKKIRIRKKHKINNHNINDFNKNSDNESAEDNWDEEVETLSAAIALEVMYPSNIEMFSNNNFFFIFIM